MKPLKRSVLPLDEQRVLERRQGSSFPHLTAKSCKSSGLPRLSSKQPLWGLTQKKKTVFFQPGNCKLGFGRKGDLAGLMPKKRFPARELRS